MPARKECISIISGSKTVPCFSGILPTDRVNRAYKRKSMNNGTLKVLETIQPDRTSVEPIKYRPKDLVCPRCNRKVVEFVRFKEGNIYTYVPVTCD
jgi:hypothetical protein